MMSSSNEQELKMELQTGRLVESFNDDDWYEFDTETRQLYKKHSNKSNPHWTVFTPPPSKTGITFMRGMKAKHMGLWVQS
jgi:hypothetical protein